MSIGGLDLSAIPPLIYLRGGIFPCGLLFLPPLDHVGKFLEILRIHSRIVRLSGSLELGRVLLCFVYLVLLDEFSPGVTPTETLFDGVQLQVHFLQL
jgi:hypothetical protein